MELVIYYHPIEDFEGNTEGVRWMACIPALPTDAVGRTKEEALERVLFEAYETIAFQLEHGQLSAADAMAVSFQVSTEQLSIEELSAMGPQFKDAAPEEAEGRTAK